MSKEIIEILRQHGEALNSRLQTRELVIFFTKSMSAKLQPEGGVDALLQNSSLYREFLAEREEILRHKWIESEKAGRDIGWETALLDWTIRHRAAWRKARRQATSLCGL